MTLTSSLTGSLAAGDDAAPPPYLNKRFDAGARPVREAGSTVICHIAERAENIALAAARDTIRASAAGGCFAWLPPSSYHMTVFDLLLYDRRGPAQWPSGLAADADEAMADRFMMDRLAALVLTEAAPFHVVSEGVRFHGGGIGVSVTGASDEDERRLRAVRDQLAEASGLAHRPGHESYGFHITLAYLIAWPDAAAAKAGDAALAAASEALPLAAPRFTLGPPELCRFHDMTAFAREAYLG